MINMFSHMACICHFVFLCPAQSLLCVYPVGSFPVWSVGSLIFFQLFRCRNLALNRVFSYFFFSGRHVFILGGWLDAPHICTPPVHLYAPHMFICPCMFIHSPGVYTTPQGAPHALYAIAWFWSIACCVGGVFLLNVYWDTPPLFGGTSPLITPPTLHCWFSVHFYSQGYQFLCGSSPFYGRFWGCSPLH